MKRLSFLTCAFVVAPAFAFTLFAADSEEATQVRQAARRLASQPNYSWLSTYEFKRDSADWRVGPTTGKTEKDGYTHVASSLGDNQYEVLIKGEKSAIKRDDNWTGIDELSEDEAWIARRMREFKPSAGEAADLAAKVKEWSREDGALVGILTEDGVKEQFRMGRRNPEVRTAKGKVKFWIKDGVLDKYQSHVEGTIVPGDDGREMNIDRMITVQIKDVGSTKVAVPEDARKKVP